MQDDIKQYDFFKQLKLLPFIDAIYLYGSRARNKEEIRSDIDLAIACPRASLSDWTKVSHIIESADTLLHLDYVRFDTLEPDHPLRLHIQKDAHILFEREAGLILKLQNLGRALKRLEEILRAQEDAPIQDAYRDAALKRFEFCIELFWKALKKVLHFEKVECTTPRDVLQKAYQFEFIDHEALWLSMLNDRNVLSHVYDEDEANHVYGRLGSYCEVMQQVHKRLCDQYGAML